MNFDDPDESDDPRVFDDLNFISSGSMKFDNPKVYGDTSIFDGLDFIVADFAEQRTQNDLLMLREKW